MDFPKRKHPRLKGYHYGQEGSYFLTLCVKNREPLLSSILVGRGPLTPPRLALTPAGEITEQHILAMNRSYANVTVDRYVIMPNHVHLLVTLGPCCDNGGMRASRPTIPTLIRTFKTMVTRDLGLSVWQSSFYDHIIRDEADFQKICRYIDNNPAKWAEDPLFHPL